MILLKVGQMLAVGSAALCVAQGALASADKPTYAEVAPILQESCAMCHGPGSSPVLTAFPFTDSKGSNLQTILAATKERINSATNPMPPFGTLPADKLALLNAWLNAGAPAN